jgi:hypothetical protein
MKSPAKKRRAPLKFAREAGCALALSAQICAWRGEIYQVAKIYKVGCQTVGAQFFFCFAKNRWMPSLFGKLLEMLSLNLEESLFSPFCIFMFS